jgi:RNA polymerase sigma factor (sigma-70 family)
MPGVGVEPTNPFEAPILSRLRIPFRHPGASPRCSSLLHRQFMTAARGNAAGRNSAVATVSVSTKPRFTHEAEGTYAVEVTTLKPSVAPGLRGASPLLRLQPDERLIALTRRGQHAAFETLFSRYHSRLLSFCRHMLGSREDAEDVLQEVFAAAFNAVLADERPINVRPWLYRIARNRSLNHLRRASAVGVDSMDVHFADHGLSTSEQVMRREGFRQLIGDVQRLPETQRTALLLREIDALSYEQIALAMDTTVPSVKSLLVRARISLAEASEARALSCEEVRSELGEVAEGLAKLSAPARRHMRDCERCRNFRKLLKTNNHALAAILPVGPLVLLKQFAFAKFGASSAAGHAAGAGGAGAVGGATGGAGAAGGAGGLLGAGAGAGATAGAGGASAAGGLVTAGAGAIATKAAATIAAAALVTAGAVAVGPSHVHHHSAPPAAVASSVGASVADGAPQVVRSVAQPVSTGALHVAVVAESARLAARGRRRQRKPPLGGKDQTGSDTHVARGPATTTAATPATPPTAATDKTPVASAPVVQVTTDTTQLPPTAGTTTSTGTVPASPPATTEGAVTGTGGTATTPAPPATEAPATTETGAPASPPIEATVETEAAGTETTNPTEAANPVAAGAGQ